MQGIHGIRRRAVSACVRSSDVLRSRLVCTPFLSMAPCPQNGCVMPWGPCRPMVRSPTGIGGRVGVWVPVPAGSPQGGGCPHPTRGARTETTPHTGGRGGDHSWAFAPPWRAAHSCHRSWLAKGMPRGPPRRRAHAHPVGAGPAAAGRTIIAAPQMVLGTICGASLAPAVVPQRSCQP
jgi:hypothetical protein